MSSEHTRQVVREVNAAIVELEERFGRNGHVSVLCECGTAGCLRRLVVPTAVYDGVARSDASFVVVPGHEHSGHDSLVDETDEYRVVMSGRSPAGSTLASPPVA